MHFRSGALHRNLTEYATGQIHDATWYWHDVFAYIFVASLSSLSVTEPGAAVRLRRSSWLLVCIGAVFMLVQLAQAWGLIEIADIDPWEWDRFRGFSENSNQLALFCAVFGLVALHLSVTAQSRGQRFVALLSMVIVVVVGRLTKSDAFLLALVVAILVFAGLSLRSELMGRASRLGLRTGFVWLVLLMIPLALAYIALLSPQVMRAGEEAALGMTKGGKTQETNATAELRFKIWSNALDRSIESAFLGLGPGPHLDIPEDIVSGRREVCRRARARRASRGQGGAEL